MNRPTVWAAAAGIAATAAGAVAGELLAGVFSPGLSPVTGVGGAIIDFVPPWLKDWAIALFGTADKVALVVGIALAITVLAAAAGILEHRRAAAGLAIMAVAGGVGLAAVLTRAQATTPAALATLAAVGLSMVLLRVLIRRLKDWSADTTGAGSLPARRSFLQGMAGTALAVAVGSVVTAVVQRAATAVSTLRQDVALPRPLSPSPPIPEGAEVDLEGMPDLVTSNRDFYRIDTALVVPSLDPGEWKLKVSGLVEREVEIDFQTLLSKPLIERHITIACVSNEVGGDLIGNARWLGWPVRELLAMAGPRPGADMVLSTSSDGWTASTPLEALTDDRDALLAVGMNGEPLPLEHGFPVRLVVPGLYGFVSATKWLTDLKVTRFADDTAYWTPRGWSERGPIKTQSRIDVPRPGRTVSAGQVQFGGVAWAQHTGIGSVHLRVDRGPWQKAELAPGISIDTWYQWRIALDLGPGQHEIQVRATDSSGAEQPESRRPVAPDGATGFHTISVRAN
jgi:DMSO/TMAO reductase YedYZ molybdopterin-dependent catalytic subunit